MKTVVDILFDEYLAFDSFFKERNEVSFQLSMETHLKKGLLLAAASYFESLITEHLISFAKEVSGGNELLCTFLKKKAIGRQYHTLFDWDKPTGANAFYSLMGDDFKNYMKKNTVEKPLLASAISAFLTIGDERNRLVHLNYGDYSVGKTIGEIYSLYCSASYFVNTLPQCLRMKELVVD
jgi:hypothetical protein